MKNRVNDLVKIFKKVMSLGKCINSIRGKILGLIAFSCNVSLGQRHPFEELDEWQSYKVTSNCQTIYIG